MVVDAGSAAQVREALRTRIFGGGLPGGTQLPAEVELARSMGVSRTSLREAILQLERDGLLIRRHGHGTFVRNARPLRSSLDANLSTTDLIRAQGMEAGTLDLQVRRAQASAYEAERLVLAKGDEVVVLERVRTANGRPVVFTRDVLPAWLLRDAGVDPQQLVQDGLSLYRFLAERAGVAVVDAVASIRPDVAQEDLAARLGVAVGTPILVIEQMDRDPTERRILLTWEHYVADAFEFVIHRRGPNLADRGRG